MKFSEEDLKKYALPLGERAQEQGLAVLEEILQTLKSMGWISSKKDGVDNLFKYKVELIHEQYGSMVLLPLGSYGNDTRGDKTEVLELGVITAQPLAELGHHLAFRLMGGYSETEVGLGSIFIDIGPANATIIRIGYTTEGGVVFSYNGRKILADPQAERTLAAEKHRVTNYSYKKLVRVIKKLHSMMCEMGCSTAKQVEPYGLERLLLTLKVEEIQHFESLSDKLKYCILGLGLLLEKEPGNLLVAGEIANHQKFFVELLKFCDLE